jgi:hypothetical protein
MSAPRWDAMALMQAMQLGHAVTALHALGVLDALDKPREASALASEFGVDETLLAALFDHLARATDLVQRRGRRYQRTLAWDASARFVVGLYGGAFGNAAARTAELLRRPALGARSIDRKAYAAVFADTPQAAGALLVGLLGQLRLRHLLDVGCGAATLLIAAARADAKFEGLGIETNAPLCKAARTSITAAGLRGRVRVIRGDGRRIEKALALGSTARIDAVLASQFINELFGQGNGAAIDWLRRLRALLPARTLLVADYYGRLATPIAADRLTLIHDHAQLLSAQGRPPSRRRDWAALYAAAGARLVHAIEDRATTRFVHVVAM